MFPQACQRSLQMRWWQWKQVDEKSLVPTPAQPHPTLGSSFWMGFCPKQESPQDGNERAVKEHTKKLLDIDSANMEMQAQKTHSSTSFHDLQQ